MIEKVCNVIVDVACTNEEQKYCGTIDSIIVVYTTSLEQAYDISEIGAASLDRLLRAKQFISQLCSYLPSLNAILFWLQLARTESGSMG